MMKIGLITFHDTNNFGSYLQTYGLYKKIVDLGYNCEIIDYQCNAIINREQFGDFKFSLNPKNILKDLLVNRVLRRKYRQLMSWLLSHSRISKKYYRHNISLASEEFDRFLVGSDIVWGMDIIEKDTTYFLDFEPNSHKKLAFASSVGNPWDNEDKSIVKPLLLDFSEIAVREEESAGWVEELTGKRPNVVCDPTMLLTAKEWEKHKSNKYASDKYVLIYFPTPENIKDACEYAKKNGLKCYVINHGLPIAGCKSVKPTTMADFLSLFFYARFVFTGSYHGMLFSIYFNREFVYYNRAHKSRMNTLARKLGVQDREATVGNVFQMPAIDYSKVNIAVENYRNNSILVLKEMLAK